MNVIGGLAPVSDLGRCGNEHMDTSRQVYATVSLLTSFATCAVWWFAFAKFRRARVFLGLAVIHTIAAASSVDNIYLAFTEHTLIPFSSSASSLAYFRAISYVQVSIWVFQAIAYVFLVRWLVQNVRRTENDT